MKTLAELKREAKAGIISGEMVVRFGSMEIPERLRGLRKMVDANTQGITFLNLDGKKSELRIEAAALVEYDGENLTIYSPGLRDLNTTEQAAMDEWKAIAATEDYQRRSTIDALSDGNSTFYQEKAFWERKGLPYMFGSDIQHGRRRDHATGKILDNQVKGSISLQYKIVRN